MDSSLGEFEIDAAQRGKSGMDTAKQVGAVFASIFVVRNSSAQNLPNLCLERTAMLRRLAAQAPFDVFIKLADGDAGHAINVINDCIDGNRAISSGTSRD